MLCNPMPKLYIIEMAGPTVTYNVNYKFMKGVSGEGDVVTIDEKLSREG